MFCVKPLLLSVVFSSCGSVVSVQSDRFEGNGTGVVLTQPQHVCGLLCGGLKIKHCVGNDYGLLEAVIISACTNKVHSTAGLQQVIFSSWWRLKHRFDGKTA